MMFPHYSPRKATCTSLVAVLLPLAAHAQQPTPAAAPPPSGTYWVYVGAESADLIQRIRFGPGGTAVEKTIQAGELIADIEGPHGLQISRDGKYLHMTTGHGQPDGKYWRYRSEEHTSELQSRLHL